ncbi:MULTISPECIES: hypothetical protein [Saccharibacillus]|uniref:Uncharacterized protein n=1 Tax=Saccharibacillus brassicae TaxID=2583377 RepID=A0A4Y6UWQ6_SACBS|nr:MULTISPECIES: hypothetical protein [Saccharibacillus]MWJ32528.1 hypothetical protein [Saccharibacillus sp. WB 17]QDH21040.1 hypothetical protein FFV09_09375 [Saccharibacillus brassicae]
MAAALKEFKNWVTGLRHPDHVLGDDDYRRLEFSVERHLHTPEVRSPITYQEEARIKMVQYH